MRRRLASVLIALAAIGAVLATIGLVAPLDSPLRTDLAHLEYESDRDELQGGDAAALAA